MHPQSLITYIHCLFALFKSLFKTNWFKIDTRLSYCLCLPYTLECGLTGCPQPMGPADIGTSIVITRIDLAAHTLALKW